MGYTDEPWVIHPSCPTFIRANEGRKHVGSTESMGDNETNKENARRIVACVNACAGISTENLEENIPIKELARRYNEVIRQRDDLLASSIDAKRYQYLRSRDLDTINSGGIFAGITPDNVVVNGDDLDEAIDKVIGTKVCAQ